MKENALNILESNADKGNVLLEEISQSYDRKDKEDFRKQTQQFLDLILSQDRLLSTRKEFSVSSWLNAARSLGTTEAVSYTHLDVYKRQCQSKICWTADR